ncbi:MAG: calcium-binding protein [Cyanobium sp.]
MAPDPRVLLDAAFAAYGENPPAGYNSTGQTITNDAGLYLTVYRKIGADEYIVAFRGTEQNMADINTDVNKGWPQYKKSEAEIQNLINELLAKASRIDITGHSLGGALAQFTAYDLVAGNQQIDASKVVLTTWNALGGEWALKQYRNYDATKVSNLQATHYYRHDDLVARLGRGHVGGNFLKLLDPLQEIADPVAAHMKEELLQGLETGTGIFKPPSYFPIADSSQQIAASIIKWSHHSKDRQPLWEELPQMIGLAMIAKSPAIGTRLMSDLGLLVGTASLQWRASQYDWTLPLPLMKLDRAIKDYIDSPVYQFSFIGGLINSIELMSIEGSPLRPILTFMQQETQSLVLGMLEKLSQIDLDRATLLQWLIVRPSLFAGLGPADIHMLPGVSNLLPFKYLFNSGLIQAASYSCPLVLDLDGDGIETLALDAVSLHFDHDGNRYAERSGWVSPDDALLVWDRDGNQRIDRGRELFGSRTPLADGSLAANGFEALKEFDRNTDGRVDRADTDWARLQLWRDRNGNGSSEAGELLSLEAAGITSLELAYDNATIVDTQGNQHRQLGSYRTSQGERRDLVDVWFQVDQADSRDLAPIPLDPQIARLPNIGGMGNVPSLHQAMQRDGTGQLRQLVEEWQRTSPELRPSLIRPLIYRWTGVANLPAGPGRGLDDIRSLAALEALMGTPYRNGEGIQVEIAGIVIGQTFEKLCGLVNNLLEAGELLDAVLKPELLRLDPQKSGYHWDGKGVISALQQRYGDQPSDDLLLRLGRAMRSLPAAGAELMASFRQLAMEPTSPLGQRLWLLVVDDHIRRSSSDTWLTGGDANELLEGGDDSDRFAAGLGHDILLGKGLNDQMFGLAGNDVLDGGTGNDDLDGGEGDDTLIGGKGDDILRGQSGRNLYCFAPGDGQDSIITMGDLQQQSINTILLQGNVQPADLRVSRLGSSLQLEISLTDRLIIHDYFTDNNPGNPSFPTYSLQFSDGRCWEQATLTHLALQGTNGHDTIQGTIDDNTIKAAAGDDTVDGQAGNDRLLGESGNDYLYGNAGDDSLDGGTGNDTLIGGLGNNCYQLSRGGGQDQIFSWLDAQLDGQREAVNRIVCDADIRPADLRLSRTYSDMKVSIIGTNDSMSMLSVFEGDRQNPSRNVLRELLFSDGTIWTIEAMSAMTMQGDDTPEQLWGLGSNDTIKGMGGNDTMTGFGGHDLMLGGTGHDYITAGAGDDTIEGGPGNDTLIGGQDNNTYRFARGDGQDFIAATWDYNPNRNNILEFATGINPVDVTVSRFGWSLHLVLRVAGSNDQITLEHFFRADSSTILGTALQQVRFQDGSTWHVQNLVDLALTGTAANEELVGTASHDRISGAGGNDTLIGAGGNDTLHGGLGNNIYHYSLHDGNDILSSYHDPNASRQNVLNFDRQIKPGDIKITRLSNRLRLDILSSGESISVEDFFRDGNILNNYNPLQIVRFGDGTSWTASTLAGMVSNLINGTSADNTLRGGAGDDWIEGQGGNDQLLGLAGNDQLGGGAGNDTLLGGDGDDLLDGGDGLDTASYAGASGSVSVDLGLNGPQATGAGGVDTLVALEHLIGGSGNDRLLGQGAANRIDGGEGDDLIDGGAGNDTLIGGNHLAGDSLSYASASAGVKLSLALTTAQTTGGAGSDVISGFEHLLGSRFSDHLSGSGTANQINGAAGNDTIQGGAGADSPLGGEGGDLFVYASPSEAGLGSGSRDLIGDWGHGDRIDLASIDARSDQGGNQAFIWIGSAPFSALGQLRYGLLGNGQGLLEGNCSGSLAADFQIELNGSPALTATMISL